MSGALTARELVRTQLRFLLFRPIHVDLRRQFWPWLVFVFLVSWAVGVGRYWDHPAAASWQYLGAGSVAYVLCLAVLIYLVVWPLRPDNWQFRSVVIFVGMTALPAILYAIPVEKLVQLRTAQLINAWFLGIVAAWRVALFVRYLLTYPKLGWFLTITVTVLMLSGIVASLSLLNLEHVVFDLMAGIRAEDASAHDTAYLVVLTLTVFALYAFPVALILYVAGIVSRRQHRQR